MTREGAVTVAATGKRFINVGWVVVRVTHERV